MVIDDFSLESNKTKEFMVILRNLKINNEKVTILTHDVSEKLFFGSRNIKNLCVIHVESASAYDLIDNNVILIDSAGIDILNKQLAN
jgi:large subunit ribosomal protein L4